MAACGERKRGVREGGRGVRGASGCSEQWNAMGQPPPWGTTAMGHPPPWGTHRHGAPTAMGHHCNGEPTAMGHPLPWGTHCNGAPTAMGHHCHGAPTAMGHPLPWGTHCHGAPTAMGRTAQSSIWCSRAPRGHPPPTPHTGAARRAHSRAVLRPPSPPPPPLSPLPNLGSRRLYALLIKLCCSLSPTPPFPPPRATSSALFPAAPRRQAETRQHEPQPPSPPHYQHPPFTFSSFHPLYPFFNQLYIHLSTQIYLSPPPHPNSPPFLPSLVIAPIFKPWPQRSRPSKDNKARLCPGNAAPPR